MMIGDRDIFNEAYAILKSVYGNDASFRVGQYEAIEATMTHRRTLVVQKTGWGKSLVYFICTKMYRKRERGITIVISPLLVLMENQMEMAKRLGLDCAAINSQIRGEERNELLGRMAEDRIDLVFITPESLFKDDIKKIIPQLRLGLFVIDEVHCISDWGHDFRLEYGKLGRLISGMFSNVSVLATTATANDRVVNDLKAQLGERVYISRGPLTRDSLHIQVLRLGKRSERYAWLLDNLKKLPGTGIIYCLDKRDCDYLTEFLNQNGIEVMSYYSRGSEAEEAANTVAMEAFAANRIKAIVATIKLGMGYDKADVGFVIHFQSPSSIVAWYQQIGRAGRKLEKAYVFLMSGREDDEINEYFIRTAFPSRTEADAVMAYIGSSNGVRKRDVEAHVNARAARIEKALYFMENEGFIRKDEDERPLMYYSTPKRYVYNEAHYEEIREIRRREMHRMHELIETSACLSRFAVNCLDDPCAENCGRCANCTGRDILPGLAISDASRRAAFDFINGRRLEIAARKRWPDGKNIKYRLQAGICLSKYGDPGYGEMVARGKYPRDKSEPRFNDWLVARAAQALSELIQEKGIEHISFVPSLRSDLVKDFARRLAARMGLEYVELLEKSPAPQQKEMENSAFQCRNAMDSFAAMDVPMPRRVLLVDDIVDSGWTLTVCGYKIMEKGCEEVYPFALASSSHEEG